ncbi:MAG: 3-keto-5-aminohexanoate cleavage protein [Burkholderiales bacterium]
MVDAEKVFSGILTGLHTEPQIKAMRKKLVINVAPTGSFTSREQNPRQPYTMAENVKAAIDAYKAGATVWHVHPREDGGLPSIDPEVARETIDRVLQVCPDMITSVIAYSDFNEQGAGLLKPMVEHLSRAGPRYIQTVPLVIRPSSISDAYTTVVTRKKITEVVTYLQDHGIRPEFQCDAYFSQRNVEEWLIKTGIATEPALMNMMAGFHGYTFSSPASDSSAGYTYISTILDSMPKNIVRGICGGGRNWLPYTIFGIMLGVDVVRVGMEDSVFVYPDRDEKMQTPAQAVEMIVKVAQVLGREIATPAEARQIMALDSAQSVLKAAAA